MDWKGITNGQLSSKTDVDPRRDSSTPAKGYSWKEDAGCAHLKPSTKGE